MLQKMTKESIRSAERIYTFRNKMFRYGIWKIVAVLEDDKEYVYACSEDLAGWRAMCRKEFEMLVHRNDMRKSLGSLNAENAIWLVQEWLADETVKPDGRIAKRKMEDSVDISKIRVFGARV